MALHIGAAITNGFGRALNRNGVLLMIAAAIVGILWQIAANSVFAAVLPSDVAGPIGPTIQAPTALLSAVAIAIFLVLPYISIVAARTFVEGSRRRIPESFLTRRIPWVLANLVVGGIALTVLLVIGTILLVIPGIIVYVSMLFMTFFIAVEDENFVAGMVDSWHLTRGNWLRLCLLLLIVLIPFMAVLMGISFGLVLVVGPASPISQVLSGMVTMPLSILILGILADAFVQLRDASPR